METDTYFWRRETTVLLDVPPHPKGRADITPENQSTNTGPFIIRQFEILLDWLCKKPIPVIIVELPLASLVKIYDLGHGVLRHPHIVCAREQGSHMRLREGWWDIVQQDTFVLGLCV